MTPVHMVQARRCLAALSVTILLTATQTSSAPLGGQFRASCAPYDGPAFEIEIPSRAAGGTFRLSANVALSQARGTWRHDMGARPGSGSIALCRKTRELTCSYPTTGSFTVTSRAGGQLRGSLDAVFEQGRRYRFAFTASTSAQNQPQFCG